MKKVMYHDMLRDDIREFVSFSGCETVNYMITKSLEREIDLKHLRKRKSKQTQIAVGQAKRPKTQDSHLGGHKGGECCDKCGRTHEGGYREIRRGSFSCG